MNEISVLDILKDGIWLIIILSAPVLLVSLVVGVAISLIQAVTQIQEATLTFVPKILLSFATMVFVSPWMLNMIILHTQQLFRQLILFAHP